MNKKIIFGIMGLASCATSYASLNDCYIAGKAKNYENVLTSCEPYLKEDPHATTLLAEANINLNENNSLGVAYTDWAQAFYTKYGLPKTQAATKSYSNALYLAGSIYFYGYDKDSVTDKPKGLEMMKASANLGNSTAQDTLAHMYINDDSYPSSSIPQSYKWYKVAAANGNLDAKSSPEFANEQQYISKSEYCKSESYTLVGDMLYSGEAGIPQDQEMAMKVYQLAYSTYQTSTVETSLAIAYMNKGENKLALEYAKKAIIRPYAPAFVVMANLTDDDVQKYVYLSTAISLFKHPNVKYWKDNFDPFCTPDLGSEGLSSAEVEFAMISLTEEQQSKANQMIAQINAEWQMQGAIDQAKIVELTEEVKASEKIKTVTKSIEK